MIDLTDTQRKLLPEWHPCEAVILAWPDEKTDWAPWLTQVQETYLQIIHQVNNAGAVVVLLCREEQLPVLNTLLAQSAKLVLVFADYNDTWVRDYAFLTCQTAQGNVPVEFIFNGWGNKFNASKDNLVNRSSLASLCINPLHSFDWVSEGGGLEIDEQGTLLSTQLCLLNPKRNGSKSIEEYKFYYERELGCSRFIAFAHGHLEGDDTDAHIDTLVRYAPNNKLVIQTAYNRPDDSHYDSLNALFNECKATMPLHTLFALPLPYITNDSGERLPASYANFLICNNTVIVPYYGVEEDSKAMNLIQSAFPNYSITGVDCSALIQQFGSLHCVSMQVPINTLQPLVIEQAKMGVSHYVA